MKKAILILSLILFGIISITGVYFCLQPSKEIKVVEKTLPKVEEKKDPIQLRLEQMTLKEKIGQMIFIAHRNTDYEAFFDEVSTYQPGGFILFKENILSYQAVLELNQKLKSLSKIPIFIGTDQEGGKVQRFAYLSDRSFTIIPPMSQVGQKEETVAEEIGSILGSELSTLGINVDFAPVLDINSNPYNTVIGNRSFGSDKNIVTTRGMALAKGLKKEGVIPVYKHFPGHGDTYEDSHYDFANIYKTKEQLLETELYPYKSVAQEKDVMIMMGHLSLPNILNDKTPSSLSPTIFQILREELGYQGVVISDALNMGALTNHYSEGEILVKAVQAGMDILLMPDSLSRAVTILEQAVVNGQISEEHINQSVLKILNLKQTYHLFDNQDVKTLTQDEWLSHQNYIQEHF